MTTPHKLQLALNERSLRVVDEALRDSDRLGVAVLKVPGGGRVVDAGVTASGGLEAGLLLARACLAGLAEVSLEKAEPLSAGQVAPAGRIASCPRVVVRTDHPVAACMASQYAGWQISVGDFFAMGSGPMRAAYAKEELFARVGFTERPERALGVLETNAIPGPDVFQHLSEKLGIAPDRISLLVASTKSLAGSLQVVARSVETALHKLLHLQFDLTRIQAGMGSAPLPPPAKDDIAALGRTNDAVLYGAHVTLWIRGDDVSIAAIGDRVPSSSSRDFGAPFSEVFERYGRDFYKVDPALFSPAQVTFQNLDTGRTQQFGRLAPDVLGRSFFG